MRTRAMRAVIVAGGGIAGILVAHALSYLVVMPDGAHRHELLLRTGHGYWPSAAALGTAALLLAALSAIGAGVSGNRAARRLDPAVLALVQSGGFVALEAVERIGAESATTLIVPLIAAGVALQVLVAFAVSLLLSALVRAGTVIRATFRAPAPRTARLCPAVRSLLPAASRIPGSLGGRAPPVPSVV